MERELKTISDMVKAAVGHGIDNAKIWRMVSGNHKLSEKTLDRLALFAGFQKWDDLRKAVQGSSDGQTNYGE